MYLAYYHASTLVRKLCITAAECT